MPERKTVKRKKGPIKRSGSLKVRGKGRRKQPLTVSNVGRFALPLFLIVLLLIVLGFVAASGYRTVTASSFFALKNVEVVGTDRTSPDDVRKIVLSSAEKDGVWNADLAELRTKIEKFPFVKTATVSRMLPAGLRVTIAERTPVAVVRLTSGTYLVDGEGTLLASVAAGDKTFPFVLQGWDESKTERAIPDNQARIKVYKKMLDDWKPFDLVSYVQEVNLTNPREPVAVIEDSGRPIPVTLARDDMGKSLRSAIEAVRGKGNKVRSVDAGGASPIIQYLEF